MKYDNGVSNMISCLKNMQTGKDRKKWADVIRGICILLVVIGHQTNNRYFHIFANQIKMPMFYVIAGMFIKPDKRTPVFIKNLVFRLGIPLVIFSLIWIKVPLYFFMGQHSRAAEALSSFLTGGSFWFVPSFFVTQVLFMFLYKVCRGKKEILAACSAACFSVGYMTSAFKPFDFWCINTALTGVIFIFTGYCFQENSDCVNNIKPVHSIICAVAYIILGIIGCTVIPRAGLDFHNVQYGYFPFNVLMIMVGIAAVITVSVCLCNHFGMRFLSILGRNTLVTYILSTTVCKLFEIFFKIFNLSLSRMEESYFIVSVVISLLVCAVCTAISEICSHFFPWSVGLKQKNIQ